MKVKAINKKYQPLINKILSWNDKYEILNEQRDKADDDGNERLFNQLDKKCENAFEKVIEYLEELPAREKKNVEKIIYHN